jgi:hypothetical protein
MVISRIVVSSWYANFQKCQHRILRSYPNKETVSVLKSVISWGYNAMWSVESQPTFRRNTSLSYSVSKAWVRNQSESRWHAESACHLLYVPPKRQLIFNGLHVIISEKVEQFITNCVRTSDHNTISVLKRDSN